MRIRKSDAPVRKIDNSLQIIDMFDGRDSAFDFVVAQLDGDHPPVRNEVSDRAYFLLSGALDIHVGEEVHHAGPQDLVLVPKGTWHELHGRGEYVIVTSPPFDPANEQVGK